MVPDLSLHSWEEFGESWGKVCHSSLAPTLTTMWQEGEGCARDEEKKSKMKSQFVRVRVWVCVST